MGTWLPDTCWATYKGEIKDNIKVTSSWFLFHTELRCTVNHTSDLLQLYLKKALSTVCVLILRCNTMRIKWYFHYCLWMWCHTAGRFAYSFWLELGSSALEMEAADLSETLAPNYQAMWCPKLANLWNYVHHIAHMSESLLICHSLPWKTIEYLLFTNGSNKWHWNTCFSWYYCVTWWQNRRWVLDCTAVLASIKQNCALF